MLGWACFVVENITILQCCSKTRDLGAGHSLLQHGLQGSSQKRSCIWMELKVVFKVLFLSVPCRS